MLNRINLQLNQANFPNISVKSFIVLTEMGN